MPERCYVGTKKNNNKEANLVRWIKPALSFVPKRIVMRSKQQIDLFTTWSFFFCAVPAVTVVPVSVSTLG